MSTATGLREWQVINTSGQIVDNLSELSHAFGNPDFVVATWVLDNESTFAFPENLKTQAHTLVNSFNRS